MLVFVVLPIVIAGGVYMAAGRATPPVIEIGRPQKLVGLAGTLDFSVDAPGGRFNAIDASLEQAGKRIPLFTLGGTIEADLRQETGTRVRITRPLGKQSIPELTSGPARIVVTASRPVLFGIRTAHASRTRDIEVRLEPPRVAVVSMHHYINHGGSEMVVYRATPPEVPSGVRVGEVRYPGFAASGVGTTSDPSLRVAFFALLHDQDLNSPMSLFAIDEAGNEGTAAFDHRVFEKTFKRSRIELDDSFLSRVVPEILEHAPDLKKEVDESSDLVPSFLKINGDVRRANAEQIAAFSTATAPRMLWSGPFLQLGNSQVESSFADHRSYFYKGEEVDQQVHLGFDLAVTANVPIIAANSGNVLSAGYLGIYGNCVILDHGLGVQSLYGHLSSVSVTAGRHVEKGQPLGRSGMTGLAGGDHLHFTMLLDGHPVSPVEWWDPHWIDDRIVRKLREAGLTTSTGEAAQAAPRP